MGRIKIRRGYLLGKELKELVSKMNDDSRIEIARGTFEDAEFRGMRELCMTSENNLIIYIR